MSSSREKPTFLQLYSLNLVELQKKIFDMAHKNDTSELRGDIEYLQQSILETTAKDLQNECVKQFKLMIKEDKQIDVCYLGAPALNPLFGSVFALVEAIKNSLDARPKRLIDDAGKLIPYEEDAKPHILSVYVKLNSHEVALLIEDNGPGFPRNMLGNYYEFYQASDKESDKTSEQGHLGGEFEALGTLATLLKETSGSMYTFDEQLLAKYCTQDDSLGDLDKSIYHFGARVLLVSPLYSEKFIKSLTCKELPDEYARQLNFHHIDMQADLELADIKLASPTSTTAIFSSLSLTSSSIHLSALDTAFEAHRPVASSVDLRSELQNSERLECDLSQVGSALSPLI